MHLKSSISSSDPIGCLSSHLLTTSSASSSISLPGQGVGYLASPYFSVRCCHYDVDVPCRWIHPSFETLDVCVPWLSPVSSAIKPFCCRQSLHTALPHNMAKKLRKSQILPSLNYYHSIGWCSYVQSLFLTNPSPKLVILLAI